MPDLIDRAALFANSEILEADYDDGIEPRRAYAISIESVRNAPTVDAVEVVRCGECIHDGMSECPLCYIENHTMRFINHDGNWYCSCGERKDGDSNDE